MESATRAPAGPPGLASLARRIEASRAFASDATRGALVAVHELSACARAHEDDISSLAAVATAAAASDGAEGSFARAVGDLVGATRTLVSCVQDQGRAQHEAATRAGQSADAIAALARDVRSVTTDARLLAVNAKLASTKLGSVGRAASVISTRVHSLAAEMQTEAQRLTDLSQELSAQLPNIAERTASLVEAGEGFSTRASAMLGRVQELHDELGRHVVGEVRACEQRVSQVVTQAATIHADLRAHEQVNGLLEQARRDALSGDAEGTIARLEHAVSTSLASVSPAVERLMSLNELARRQATALGELAARLKDDDSSDHLSGLSRALAAMVDAFTREARGLIERQLRGVALAVESERRHYGAAQACQRLVIESRMLTLAVRIEAARIGAPGVGILPIADQLRGFTDQLDQAVAGAANTTETLSSLLGQLHAHSAQLNEVTESFATEAGRAHDDLEEALRRAGVRVEGALSRSQGRAESLRQASYALVTHLQFQDRFTQEARSIQGAISDPAPDGVVKTFLDAPSNGISAGEVDLF